MGKSVGGMGGCCQLDVHSGEEIYLLLVCCAAIFCQGVQ